MNQLYYFFLIAVLSWNQVEEPVLPSSSETPPSAISSSSLFCHQEQVWQQLIEDQPDFLQHQRSLEEQLYQRTIDGKISNRNAFNAPPYELPIVVHIIHNNGTENISDGQVLDGLRHLNEAYGNRGYYDQGTGVDTRIQFCLAQQDPNGNTTTGINRIVSSLTNMTSETDDLNVKDLSRWNPTQYINIWLVREVCSLSSGCGVAGYAYFPSSHGSSIDGIMMEARYFGTSEGESGVQIHEMGHYLGLYHTFQGGCANNDCLRDGDRVCDTPPDQSTAAVRCGDTVNSCSTDVNPADPNNPFTTDQEDMYINYMDYGDFDCYSALTAGQTVRMHDAIETVRSSLLTSKACQPACLSPITAGFRVLEDTILLGATISFMNTSTGATSFDWKINGIPFPGGIYTFNTLGTFNITLVASNGDPNCEQEFSLPIVVLCSTMADFTFDSFNIEVGDSIVFTNTSTGASTFEWTVEGVAEASSTDFTYQGTTPGIFTICLTADNGNCQTVHCQGVVVTEPIDCSSGNFQELIRSGGGDIENVQIMESNGELLLTFRLLQGSNNIGGTIGLTKLGLNGEVLWMKTYEYPINSYPIDFVQTNDGGYAVTINTSLGEHFILKTDADGNFLWSQEFRDLTNNSGFSLVATSDGGLAIQGTTNTAGNRNKGQLIKLDRDGNIEWNTQIEHAISGPPFRPLDLLDMVSTPDDGYLLVGREGNTGFIRRNLSVIKLDENGDLEWGREYNKELKRGMEVALNAAEDGYYLLGMDGGGFNDSGSVELVEIDLNGIFLRHQSFDRTGGDFMNHIQVLNNGQILISGQTSIDNTVGDDLFLLVLDQQWNTLAAEAYGQIPGRVVFDGIYGKRHAVVGDHIYLAGSYSFGEIFLTKTNKTLASNCSSQPITFNERTLSYSSFSTNLRTVKNRANTFPYNPTTADVNFEIEELCQPSCEEICDNGTDDDDDGLIDFYDPDCPCIDTLSCGTSFFSNCVDNCVSPTANNIVLNRSNSNFFMNEASYMAVADIDGDCTPDIMVQDRSNGFAVLDGQTRNLKYLMRGRQFRSFCLGDVDQDGQAEIFVMQSVSGANRYELTRYDVDLALNRLEETWTSNRPVLTTSQDVLRGFLNPFLADFNQDGRPEVYVGNQIFDSQSGWELVNGGVGNNRGGASVPFPGGGQRVLGIQSSAIAVDLLDESDCVNCGGLELAAGNQVFAVTIQSYTDPSMNSMVVASELPGMEDGVTAVVDFDQDGDLDVVVGDFNGTSGGNMGRIYIWDPRSVTLVGNPIVFNRRSSPRISIPAIGDVDGDGRPEIVVNNGIIHVFEDYVDGGQANWGNDPTVTTLKEIDSGDHGVAMLLFDFNLDGKQEIVMRNNDGLTIYDENLNILAIDPIYAFTQDDSAIIADVDDDQEAEIITYGCSNGPACHEVLVYESGAAPWPDTRKVWNQYSYFNVNVNDDGTIPIQQQAHQLPGLNGPLNNFTQQYAIPSSKTPEARLSIKDVACTSTGSELTFEVCNDGSDQLPAITPIAVYQGNPTLLNAPLLLGLNLLTDLDPGNCVEFKQTLSSSDSIYVVVNDDGSLARPYSLSASFPLTTIEECDYLNNIGGIELPGSNPLPLNLGPDQLICDNGVFPLSANSGFVTYRWFDGTTESTNTVYGPGTYWVEAADSCGNLQRDSIIITINPLTAVDLGPDQTICLGDTLTLDAGAFDHYRWYPSLGISCDTCRLLDLRATQDTQVIITAWSDLGCYTTDTISIQLAANSNTIDTQYVCAGDTLVINTIVITTDTILIESFPALSGCDSTTSTYVIMLDTFYTTEQLDLCAGDTALIFGQIITRDTVLEEANIAINGCDSTHAVTVLFRDTFFTSEQLDFCAGDTALIFGQTIIRDTVLQELNMAINGCDSTHEVTILFRDTFFTSEQLDFCAGDTALVFGQTITRDTILEEVNMAINGCDSTHAVTILFRDTFFTSEQLDFCAGDTALVFGQTITRDTILEELNMALNGCDSTHAVTILFRDTFFTSEQLDFCAGDTASVFGQMITRDTILEELNMANNGCDSTHAVTILFRDTFFTSEQLDFCMGDMAQIFGQTIIRDTILQETSIASNGCDSTHEVTVLFQDTIFTFEQLNFCIGDMAQIFGQTIMRDTILQETNIASSTCDSTHEVTVLFRDTFFTTEQLDFCIGDVAVVFGQTITRDTILQEANTASNGCDSTHQVRIFFRDTLFTTEQLNFCAGDTVLVFGQEITADTVLEQTSVTSGGCDSTHQVAVVLLEQVEELQFETICPGDYWLFFNDTLSLPGIYEHTETPLSGGCDIRYILTLEVVSEIEYFLVTDTTIQEGQVFSLPLQVTNPELIISWSPANLLTCSDCLNPMLTLSNSQVFTVIMTDQSGCSTMASILVGLEEGQEEGVYIPNVFTPNGDQINDRFTVFSDPSVLEVLKLQVFDRWGGLLYEATGLRPNDPRLGWDGTSKGEALNPGVYIYQISLRFEGDRVEHFAGDLTLLR